MRPVLKGSDIIIWGIASRETPCLIRQSRRGLRTLADDLLHVPPHDLQGLFSNVKEVKYVTKAKYIQYFIQFSLAFTGESE